MEQINIIYQGKTISASKGTTAIEALSNFFTVDCSRIIAVMVNNQIRELNYRLHEDCDLEPVDITTGDGQRIYIRSLVFVFIRACREVFPDCKVSIEHSFGGGLYCEVHGDFTLTPRQVHRIEHQMRKIVEADEPFVKIDMPVEEAGRIFREMGFDDKLDLLRYRTEDKISLYKCGWMYDYLYGYMVPSTGCLKTFGLKFYLPGVVLRYPDKENPSELAPFKDSPKLFTIFRQSEKWAKIINIENIADLNRRIEEGRGGELIRICEAQHEKQIAFIADEIARQKDRIRLVLIAGPSSSGKTTFAQRLKIQMMVNGLLPVPISMDNYYLDRDDIPMDDKGERDLESIDAIDLELFNEQMTRLIQGQRVEIPTYNFSLGKRVYTGTEIKVNEDQPIIVEGIHGLNEKLTEMIPRENKYKIYISALTQLNIDDHNRIPTTDTRLIRRMVRDHQFRGTSIEATLDMWASVRRGEEKYIFPFQESADIMLNSALVYELAVLKPYILSLLEDIPDDHRYFPEINRLRKFLKYFVDLDATDIPNNSILREFIGGSCFHV
ncbi:MAG TPA: nucleoside kinase [Candidatus Atribacteria bacterium]|nr:nucleoside kinase [Candidatus Atribacteria bacterium]HPT77680.1 nucleoside kinase [Candidatus Atribacteria bacterium]